MTPDDRFADLGRDRPSAGDRLAELDRREPEPRPEPPRRRGRYSWVVGVAAVIAIAVVYLNSARHENRGNDGPPVGKPLPRFAAPASRGPLDGDPNINQSASDPAPGDTPACAVRVPGAVRICDYTGKPLVMTFIAPTGECEDFVDRVDALRPRFPRVNFLTVISASSKDRADKLATERGWRDPVVVDRNGAVLTLYRVSFCATVVFAYRGGIVRATRTSAQKWSEAQFAAAIRATERRP
jgi:hypothetical protein